MTQEASQCSQHFIAHDDSIRQAKTDIDKLYTIVGGLPTDIRHIIDALSDLKKSMNANGEKYVSKEVMELKLRNIKDELKLWMYGAIGSGILSIIIGLYYITHMSK